SRVPLQDDEIHYAGQHLGVVVAESFEQATYAVSLVQVTYQTQPPVVTLDDERVQKNATFPEKFAGREALQVKRGDVDAGPATAAKLVQRPVKLTLTRPQMFDSAGQRARTEQRFSMGAGKDGKLVALRHATTTHSSPTHEYTESCGNTSRMLYSCPNVEVSHRLVRLNLTTPCPMRAPGETPGVFALECALDEMAHEIGVDPVEFRLRNYAEIDEYQNKPWSSKKLR